MLIEPCKAEAYLLGRTIEWREFDYQLILFRHRLDFVDSVPEEVRFTVSRFQHHVFPRLILVVAGAGHCCVPVVTFAVIKVASHSSAKDGIRLFLLTAQDDCRSEGFRWPTNYWAICLQENKNRFRVIEGGLIYLFAPSARRYRPLRRLNRWLLLRRNFSRLAFSWERMLDACRAEHRQRR